MKKFLAGLLLGVVLATGALAFADPPAVRLFVDGKDRLFESLAPK